MIQVLIVLVIVGFVLYLIETYVPLTAPIKTVIRVVVVILLCLYLLELAGIQTGLPRFRP